MKKITILIYCLLFVISLSGQESVKINQELSDYFPLPKVDKRVELLSIVFRLAGNREYNNDSFKDYVKDIHDHFDKYKSHPLITFAKELHDKNSVSFDAVMFMAVYLEQPPALKPVLPFSGDIPEKRWGEDNSKKFVKLLQQFYVDAKCEEFFDQHEELYKTAQERFKPVYDGLDISWFKKFYGVQPSGSLNIILGPCNGGNNYGPKVVFPGGREDNFAIMGAWSFDTQGKPVYSLQYLPLLIHEFNHSFVNQLIDRNEKALEEAGKALFQPIKDMLRRQNYDNWKTMMTEALVRASVIRYIKPLYPNGENEIINNETRNGFVWMRKLNDILQEYENSRDKYPTLESFMPRIVSFYDNLAKECNILFANCAHVKSIEPFENNSTEVSSELTEMKVIFDKPLSGNGYSVYLGQKGMEHFPVVSNGVRYSDNNSSILLTLKLKPNTDYEFLLVGQKFATTEGYPLIDYKVAFKTK